MKDDIIRKVALDIGNNRIKLLVGEMSSDFQRMAVTKYINVKSKGIKRSVIENSEQLAEAIGEAIRRAESLEEPITKVSLALGGPRISSVTTSVNLSFPEKEIEKTDMDDLLKEAKNQIFSEKEGEYRILYKEIYNKKIDRTRIAKNPVGMVCKELQADVHLVYVEESYVKKFTDIINKVGLDVDRIYLNPYASAKGTLDGEAWKLGVIYVDIGYASTSVTIVKKEKVLYARVIPLGETHYITDLMSRFNISESDSAEIIKKLKNKEFEADATIRCGTKKILLKDVKDIISARTEDIVQYIKDTIEISSFNEIFQKGIVLSGGTIEIEGVYEQIANSFNYKVRRIEPIPLKGLSNPSYSDAVVIGIFLEDMEKEYRNYIESIRENEIELEKERQEEDLTSLNNKINNKQNIEKMDRKEEIDDFLNEIEKEEPKKEAGKIKKMFKWVKELF